MSADLFAEFGSDPSQQQNLSGTGAGQARTQPTSTSFSFFDDLSYPASAPVPQPQPQSFQFGENKATTLDDDPDDWGDFEGVSLSQPAHVQQDPFAFTSTQPSQYSQTSWQKAPILKAKTSSNPNVLFDAEDDPDDDDDDEFGDFEGVESNSTPAAPQRGSTGLEDLLGGMNVSPLQPSVNSQRGSINASHKLPASSSVQRSPAGAFSSVSQAKQPSATTPSSTTTKQEDSWATFDDWEASIPTKPLAKNLTKPKATTKSRSTPSQSSLSSPTFDEPQPRELPPTNVPPPGVLLTLFPPLFEEAQNKLFKPMAAQTLPMRNKLLAEPATITYLQGYLMLASVAARIIAGRKLRWKRDVHLSQGMRIGPASSRATSGMKLTGIDRSENMKEEREVSEVVRVWKDQMGRLRHVVSAANQIKSGTFGAIADLQETMPVRALKQSEGGVPAPQPCMMCGLKREERVSTVDQAVEDSFGEWWVDQVFMHRGCRNFWHEHRDRLRQR